MAQRFAGDPVAAAAIVDQATSAAGAVLHFVFVDKGRHRTRARVDQITLARRKNRTASQFHVVEQTLARGGHAKGLGEQGCELRRRVAIKPGEAKTKGRHGAHRHGGFTMG